MVLGQFKNTQKTLVLLLKVMSSVKRSLYFVDAQLKNYITCYMALSRHRSSNRAAILNVQAPGSDNARTTSPNTEKRQTVFNWKTPRIHLIKNHRVWTRPSPPCATSLLLNQFIARPLSKHDLSCLFRLCSQTCPFVCFSK